MSERKSGTGWKVAVFILVAIFLVQATTNAQKSNKIKQLDSQLSTAQISSQAANSASATSTPTITTPNLAEPNTTAKPSWLCNNSLDTGLGNISLNLLCTPNYGGGTDDLSCTGNISTDLTSSSYTYAPLNMTCSEE